VIRTVVDTNVFISSFFGGNPRRIIDLWKNGEILLCLSPEIVEEYVEVLQRFSLPEGEIKELLKLFAKGYHVVFTHTTPNLNIVADNPDDDKFIECAVALEADFIVSGDKDLLSVKKYMGIRILSPRGFLEHVQGNDLS
jgi:putative PIN family toxin of toxin-antitoxin system